MNHEQARQAVVGFLDQFISRGATSEVIALRDRLRFRGSERELLAKLATEDPSPVEVYEAMRGLFWDSAVRPADASGADFVDLYSWTVIEKDGLTGDPAQWHDWCSVLEDLDLEVPDSRPPTSPPWPEEFRFRVFDVFTLTGRGTAVIGEILSGGVASRRSGRR